MTRGSINGLSTGRIEWLDILRGISVLSVLFLHSGAHANGHDVPMFENVFWPVIRHGYLGVQAFFVISGYCITGAVDSALRSPTPLKSYFYRRLRRIYPPFWFSVLLAVSMGLGTVWLLNRSWWSIFPLTLVDWVLNLLLLQGPFIATPDAVMVYWSLTVEVQFYVLMAVCILLNEYRSVWLIGLSVFYVYWSIQPWVAISGTPLAYWPEFACGIAAYAAHNPKAFFPATHWWLWGLSGMAILLGYNQLPESPNLDGELATPLKQLFCLCVGLLIWKLQAFGGVSGRSRFLKGLNAIGVISYSLYLTHVPITTRVFNLASRLNVMEGTRWYGVAVISGLLQFAVGLLFFYWCEQPWLNRESRSDKAT